MSRENVELFRTQIEGFLAAGDLGREDRLKLMDLYHPEIEWDASEVPVPDIAGVYRGSDSVLGFWRQWLAAWESLEFEYELVDAGDRVVMLVDHRMRGRSTGIEVPFGKYAQVATFRDGLMVHWQFYLSQSEALEAVGLSE
jgi:hypothetical protein